MNDFAWIAPTVASVAAAIVAIIGAIRSKDNGRKADENRDKLIKIGVSTDGNLSRITEDNRLLTEKVDSLQRLVESMTKSADAVTATASDVHAATEARAAAAENGHKGTD